MTDDALKHTSKSRRAVATYEKIISTAMKRRTYYSKYTVLLSRIKTLVIISISHAGIPISEAYITHSITYLPPSLAAFLNLTPGEALQFVLKCQYTHTEGLLTSCSPASSR